MKRFAYAMCLAAFCGMVGVSAQSASQSTDPQKSQMKTDKSSVTVTGCVADKDASGHYMLNNASSGASSATSSTTGTSGTTTAAAMSYELSGGDLKAHVGHKVEVTGTVEPSKDNTGTSGSATPAASASASSSKSVLRVKSVKMVSDSCQ